ncbi:DNA adenine methylase [Sulfurimonas sp. HSL-1716]|uniref:DNA adenine methylase n=1 Tax=Hydrocurvibacter sulfurireducens TaxID=3131937 RepID=UPI0031F98FA9
MKKLPVTRYYGSKRKIILDIWNLIEQEKIQFDSVLDLFGGTGTFAYKAKLEGKQVIYNDIFKFNYLFGKALLQNNTTKLTQKDVNFLITKQHGIDYKYYVKEHYKDIYFLDHENELIDIIVQNISHLKSPYKRAMAFYALSQTAIIKRPFNSFHRKNLSLRTRDVKRKFGNKTTWEKDLVNTFKVFCKDINQYIISNGLKNKALNYQALKCQETADLIYIDPPYISERGYHLRYHERYHFLEALAHYDSFLDFINPNKKNKEVLINNSDEFENKHTIHTQIDKLIKKYHDKVIVFSYRNLGIPSATELRKIFEKNNKSCKEYHLHNHFYALNRSNDKLHEIVFILQ